MTFIEGTLLEAILTESKRENNGQLIHQEIELDPIQNLPITPVFWSTGSIVAAILNCAPKQITAIMCISAYEGKRFGITIEKVPKAVIISQEDTVASNALFSKTTNSVANREKDYVLTVLQTQKHMLSVVPIRPDQVEELFDPDGTPRSVRTVNKVFEGRKTVKDTLFRNWIRAAFVAKNLDNNADSTSQLQIEPDLPVTFTAEQSSTFYTDLSIGFDEEDHTFGTTVANGITNTFHPSFVPPPEPEVIDVDNDRNVRPRPAPPDTSNDALLQRILQLEENLQEQQRLRRTAPQHAVRRTAPLQSALRPPNAPPATAERASFDVPFDRVVSEYERRAEDAIERYENISTTRTLTTQEQTHLRALHRQFPEAGDAIDNAARAEANRVQALEAAAIASRSLRSHPRVQPVTDNGFSSGSSSQFDHQQPPPTGGDSNATNPFGTSTTNPFGDTAYGTSGLTGPFASNTFVMGLPTPEQTPATMDIAQRLHELQGKAIAGHLTTEEMNAFNVLKAGLSNSGPAQAPSATAGDTLGTRGFNLCGWAHLQPAELAQLHKCNDNGWLRFARARNKEERKAVIDAYFVQPLVRKNGRFRQILTTEFRDLILNWRLAPKNFDGSKPHGGLGPLSFVPQTLAEQENLEFYRTLNSLAAKPTTADIEKTIPGTPKIPDNVDGLITILVLNQLALVQIIGDKAPPAVELQRLVDALYDNYNRLIGIHDFRTLVSNKIIYQLCRHLERYFEFHCTEADVTARNFPKFNIDFLILGVENNNMTMSHYYGPIFAPPKPTMKSPPPTQGGGGNGGGGAKKRAADRKAAASVAQPVLRTGPGCDAIRKLVEEHRAKNENKFPRLSDIRTANNFATSKDMCAEIGLNANKCIMWGLYCSCKGRCRTPHQTDFSDFKPERALEIMLKATKA